MLSTTPAPLVVVQGVVPSRGVAAVPAEITPGDLLSGRSRTIFAVTVQADAGSGLGATDRLGDRPGRPPAAAAPCRRHRTIRRRPRCFSRTVSPARSRSTWPGNHGTSGGFSARFDAVGDLNGDGRVDLADQAAFAPAYLTKTGDGFFNPAADANANGFVGQGDALAQVHNLTPLTRPIPLSVTIALAPEDRPKGHISQKNSGGFTYKTDVTIVGRTTPGSVIFSDSGLGDYSFTGPILHTDANGIFTIRQHLADKLTNTEFLIIDPSATG